MAAAPLSAVLAAAYWYVDHRLSTAKESASERAQEALRERAERAERELAELRETLKPRTIGPEGALALTAALRAAEPRETVEVFAAIGDPEALLFARQIRSAIASADWPVKGDVQLEVRQEAAGLPFSVLMLLPIALNESFTVSPAAHALHAAMLSAGIWMRSAPSLRLPPGTISIIVNNKPTQPAQP